MYYSLDEVTNVLDEAGKENVVEILLREENLNTYIVSHGWTHPLLSKIEVIKEDKISRLEWSILDKKGNKENNKSLVFSIE